MEMRDHRSAGSGHDLVVDRQREPGSGRPRRGRPDGRGRVDHHERRNYARDDSRRLRLSAGVGTREADDRGVAVLTVRELGHRVDQRPVLQRLSFEIRAGEAYGLTGGPGAGKTTVVRAVCGLLAPTSGAVLLRGRPVEALDPETVGRSIGYVRHSVATLASATVAETLRFWARLAGLPRLAAHERTAEVLHRLGLTARADDRFDGCPIGVQRELSLAVALLHRPALLVLDEPTRGVDAGTRDRLLATLRALRDEGTAVLYATRRPDEVRGVCDQVGLLHNGRLSWEGRPEQGMPAA